ncbi:hypothetical protein [Pseudonocardia sp. McavD-2-B]|uniref:hypothetical protein n=1 Tax=Pseudonocardia sp. McavD-2-B TaxID=2954499 RepID=UPI0020973B64|nr:hypothetical protein [Pseudonocardia sp. McavD-2-B]MCO7192300.1 hypothetical protein [Pseudonocardia sp. McavD-2-B]
MDAPDQTLAEQSAETADETLYTARRSAAGVDDRKADAVDVAQTDALMAQAEQTRALRLAVVEAGQRIARAIERAGE